MTEKNDDGLTSRQRRAQDTRKRVLESAIALFQEKGFDAVSVDEITQAAGTSKGSFYTYFTTKSDIVKEEFRLIDVFYESKLPEIRRLKSSKSRLLAFTRYQLDYLDSKMGYRTLAILYMNQLSVVNEEKFLTSPERPLIRILRELVAEGQDRAEIRRDRKPEELALWVARCMRGFFLDWAISRGAIDIRAVGMDFFKEFVLRGLLSNEA
ncbi:MAG TPA: TetR/AcrR family transcriptional regulator [Rectinemataceae bacterium]|nr:TetR/AcrR family transcriptional regulator [Rectinemataceae bacterium]